MHSKLPKLHRVLAVLSAIGLLPDQCDEVNFTVKHCWQNGLRFMDTPPHFFLSAIFADGDNICDF